MQRTLHRLALVLLASSLAGSNAAGERPDGFDFDAQRQALVQVGEGLPTGERIALQWRGSGFLVDARCTVVTARHVVEDAQAERLMVGLPVAGEPGRTRTYPARPIHLHDSLDLAFLRITGIPGEDGCASAGLPQLSLAEGIGADLAGEEVVLAGFPMLEGNVPRSVPILRFGHLASAELQARGESMLLLDLSSTPGFSGAPVILRRSGEVIGVVFGPGRTGRQYGFNWATPITKADYDAALERRP